MENGQIEIAPLAYMRGRTLHNSFIILDEALNSTQMLMKMFLKETLIKLFYSSTYWEKINYWPIRML